MSFGDRFRIGANFWSRDAGPRTWSRAAPLPELRQAHALGLDLLRVFAFIPDFVTSEGAIAASPLARLRAFADEAARLGVSLLPTPLVGHMSGENFDWPGSADPLAAPVERLVEAVVAALGDSPSVIGWALTNEAPLWLRLHEGRRIDDDTLLAWIDRVIAACRARSRLPLGLGDGQMHGFGREAITARVDFVAPHVYYADVDPLRQGYRFDHALGLAARAKKPTLLEEFGASSSQAGDSEHAALWNEALFAAFSCGAIGALGWCWSDFPTGTVGREAPYTHHAFELGFGLTRADGSEKPACDTIRAWRSAVDALPAALPVVEHDAVLVRTSWLERDYPFSWFDRSAADRAELTAYVLATQAGISAAICDEHALADAPLYIVPSTQRLLTETWLALEAKARAGATVYWSWHGGDHDFHQGAWCPIFEQLTGCRHRLRYGCFDLPPAALRLEGALAAMSVLPTDSLPPPSRALLPIEPGPSARVLSADDGGRPILVEHTIGAGRVLFCAAPIERYAAALSDGTQRGLVLLYRALASELADPLAIRTHAIADAERLTIRRLHVGDRHLIAAMNRSWSPALLPAQLQAAPRWRHAPAGAVATPGALAPKEALLLDA